ncbi:MAG TPA: hypothetical protein VEI02_00825, partial [Planctomycetota bacterium]|nr:hypothetical protein [Planctomycetota bacterium]
PTGVRGRVVDERDAGVAGAVLRWTPSRRTRRGGSEPTTPPSAAEGRATADGDGRFDFVPAGGATLFDLVAEAPGFAPTRRDDVPIGAVDVTLRLGPGLAVSGTVADLDGRPVAGAVVVYHARLGDRPVTAATTSASDGRYAFEHLPIDPAVRRIDAGALEVTAEGRAPQIKPLGAALPGERPGRLCADVRLARGAVLEGTVRDPAGAPIAEAEVELWMNAAAEAPARPGFPVPASDPAAARRILRGRTDRSGRYRLEHVPVRVAGIEPGSRYALFNTRRESAFLAGGLVVAAPGRAATGAVVLLADADEAVVTVDVVLPPAVTLSGVARDAHGAPLSGGVVKARLASDDLQQATTAVDRIRGRDALAVAAIDAAGAWRLTDLPPVAPPGRLEISAEAPGVATHVVAWSEGAARDLELSAIPTRSIRGVVVDDRGAPVAGAVVTLGPPSRRAEIAATATDLDGAFEATLPRDVVAAEWRVSHPGRAQLRLPWTARDVDVEHDAPLRLVLAPERTLRGTVRSAEGLPVAGALVAAFPVDVSGALPPLASLEGDPSRAYAETATDSAGAFALTGLPAGPACLRVGVPWPRNDGLVALLLGRKFCVVTSAPETAEPAVITLPAYRAERGALVVHAAETSTGAPILRGLKGALHAPDGMVGGFGIVAGPGLLVFHDVPVGTYRLAVEAAGFAETAKSDVTVGGAAGSPEVRVELERGARLVGRTRRDGAHAAGATFVRARRFSGAPELRVPCRDDGTFEVEGLSAGAWRVWAEVQEDGVPPAMISRTERVALEIGRTAPPLDLRLLPVEPTTLRLSGMFDGRAAPTLDKRSPAWGDMVRRFGEHRLTCRDAGGAEWIDVALDAVPYQLDGRDVVFHLPLPRGFYDVVASRAERKVAALRIASPGRAEADVSEE